MTSLARADCLACRNGPLSSKATVRRDEKSGQPAGQDRFATRSLGEDQRQREGEAREKATNLGATRQALRRALITAR